MQLHALVAHTVATAVSPAAASGLRTAAAAARLRATAATARLGAATTRLGSTTRTEAAAGDGTAARS